MEFSKELLEKVNAAETPEDLIGLAKEKGFELPRDRAVEILGSFKNKGEIPDEELDNVAGGCGDSDPSSDMAKVTRPPKVKISIVGDSKMCPYCNVPLTLRSIYVGFHENADKYDDYVCPQCGEAFRHYWEGDEWTLDHK